MQLWRGFPIPHRVPLTPQPLWRRDRGGIFSGASAGSTTFGDSATPASGLNHSTPRSPARRLSTRGECPFTHPLRGAGYRLLDDLNPWGGLGFLVQLAAECPLDHHATLPPSACSQRVKHGANLLWVRGRLSLASGLTLCESVRADRLAVELDLAERWQVRIVLDPDVRVAVHNLAHARARNAQGLGDARDGILGLWYLLTNLTASSWLPVGVDNTLHDRPGAQRSKAARPAGKTTGSDGCGSRMPSRVEDRAPSARSVMA